MYMYIYNVYIYNIQTHRSSPMMNAARMCGPACSSIIHCRGGMHVVGVIS